MRLRIHLTYAAKAMLEKSTEYMRTVSLMEIGDGDLKTTVKGLDGNILIPTRSALMKTAYTFYKGAADSGDTDKRAGGFAPTATAKDIHWLIVPGECAHRCVQAGQGTDLHARPVPGSHAWHVDYRRYFQMIVPANKAKGLFACVSAAAAG